MKNLMSLILLTVLSLTACGLHPNSSTTDTNLRKEESDRQKLKETYGQIQGWYEGQLTASDKASIKTQISLFYVEVPNGKNSDGETKYLPVLRGRFIREDRPEDTQVLDARYIPESGALTLTSQSDSNGKTAAGIEYVYINGQLINGRFSGEVKNLIGSIGRLDITMVSRDVNSPVGGEKEDRYARLRERMRELEGTFIGQVEESTNNPAHRIELRFTVTEVLAGNEYVPTLIGWFRRLDNEVAKPVRMSVRYSIDTRRLVLDSQSTENFNFNGTFENGIISGIFQSPRYTSRLTTGTKRP